MRRIRHWKAEAGKKQVLFSAVFYMIFFLINVGNLGRLMKRTGVQILDTRFYYSAESAWDAFTSFGEEGRLAYRNDLWFDSVFTLVCGWFLFCLIGYLINRLREEDSKLGLVLLFPLLGMIFDLAENLLILSMLFQYPRQLLLAGSLAGIATCHKSIFSAATLVTILLLLIAVLRKKRTTTDGRNLK